MNYTTNTSTSKPYRTSNTYWTTGSVIITSTNTSSTSWSNEKYTWDPNVKLKRSIVIPGMLFNKVDEHFDDIGKPLYMLYGRIPPMAFSGGSFSITGLKYTTSTSNTTCTDSANLTITLDPGTATQEQLRNLTTVRIGGVLYPR